MVFVSDAKKSSYEEDLEKLNITTFFVELNSDSFNRFIKELEPSHVVYDRFMTEEPFGWRVRKELPNTFEILNTEDLHFLRDTCKKNFEKTI